MHPATDVALRFKVPPVHGELPLKTGAAGVGLIVMVIKALELHPVVVLVMVTEYVPDAIVCTLEINGSTSVDVKLFGPVQL